MYIGDYREESWLRIPPLADYVRWYEEIAAAVHPTKVIGISPQYLRPERGGRPAGL